MLDIVITHYKEAFEVGKKLFQSLALQRCIDFQDIHVTVVNDGGHRIPDECFDDFPYPVKQIDIEHGGVSKARNTGIDNAKEPWIMFCDFDDSFASIFSVREILNVLNTEAYDMLWSRIIAEDYVDGKQLLYFVPDKQRFVFCHGKVYRTAFLREKNIRFDETLVFNEDSCFNAVIVARTPYTRIGELNSNIPIYCWIRRISSVTNSGREDEAAYGHFRRNLIVTKEYEDIDDYRVYGMVTRTVYDAYYMVFGHRNSAQFKRRMVDEFTPWIAERMDLFGNVSESDLEEIRQISRLELTDPEEDIPDDINTVTKWFKSLVDIYRNAR